MNYFFHPFGLSEGNTLTLSEEEGRHAIKVLRLIKGDLIHIINGLGQLGECEITRITGSQVDVNIISLKTESKADYNLTIGLAMLKKRDRLEWFIEKAVELAASKVIIFSSQHTEKNKTDVKRLNKIMISAVKQSGNLWMPEIIGDVGFKSVVSDTYTGSKFIAHCREDEKQLLSKAYKPSESAFVLIGPEGDFSGPEIKQALENNFIPVSLGDLRLRAETAALTALVTLQIANQK